MAASSSAEGWRLRLAFYGLGPTLANYTGGLSVTAGDSTGDGKADVFVGAYTGDPEVAVYSAGQLFGGATNLTPFTAFYVYNPGPNPDFFTGENGVQLAFAQVPLNGHEGDPTLLAATNQLSIFQSSAQAFNAIEIFQNPGAAPGNFSDSVQFYPFGANGTPPGDQFG